MSRFKASVFFLLSAVILTPEAEAGARTPADLLSLEGWKLTLPVDADGRPGADEISGADLREASMPGIFFL